jgi:hypothetical protein
MGSQPSAVHDLDSAERNGGGTSLVLSWLFVSLFLLQPFIVLVERVSLALGITHSPESFAQVVGLLEIFGSITTLLAGWIAIIALFRPGISWSRKGWIWLALVAAAIAHRIAWAFVLPRP